MKKISYVSLSKPNKKRIVDTTNHLIRLSVRSPGLVRYHNTQVDSEVGTIHLFMEYFPEGSLEKLIRESQESRHPIDVDRIWSIATDIALALYECHSSPEGALAHGALTADHVFIDADGAARIGCFSLNTCLEVDKDKDLDDLGVLVYEMATLSPFVSKREITGSRLRHIDEGLRNLIVRLLNPARPDEKFTLLNVLEYPEIALKVLQKKLKIETDMYEQEKQRYMALKDDVQNREKRAAVETSDEVPFDA
jgi:serine/threonine protein kinase